MDLALPAGASSADWERLGALGESIGLEWGGRWKGFPDPPHFQFRAGLNITDVCPDPAACAGADAATPAPRGAWLAVGLSTLALAAGGWIFSR